MAQNPLGGNVFKGEPTNHLNQNYLMFIQNYLGLIINIVNLTEAGQESAFLISISCYLKGPDISCLCRKTDGL